MAGAKRVPMTMQSRLNILKDLKKLSIDAVAKKYNVHRTTIFRIQQREDIIKQFTTHDPKAKDRKRIKRPMYEELEKRLLTWFSQKRTEGAYISDAILLQKAIELNKEFGASSQFKASRGWLSKFKKRHNIRLVRTYGEKSSVSLEIEEYIGVCSDEENGDSEEITDIVERRNEERVGGEDERRVDDENDERLEDPLSDERVKCMEEEREERREERNGRERKQERGIDVNTKERKELEDIFKRLESYESRVPRSTQLLTEALKVLYLGETSSNNEEEVQKI